MQHGTISNGLVQKRVARLAREYRQNGYEVVTYPSAENLPDSLEGCLLDLVAEQGSEVVAVVVRTRETLTLNGPHDLRRITEIIDRQPNWDLEVVVTNPRPRRLQSLTTNESLSA